RRCPRVLRAGQLRAPDLPRRDDRAVGRRRRGNRDVRGARRRSGNAGVLRDMSEIRSARSLSPAKRAELFNAAYEGYILPFHVDEEQLALMDKVFDFDRDASRVAFLDGKAIGLGNLDVRGDEAWIGGVGVVPSARRTGVGEALMRALHEQARELGVRR